MDFFTIIIYQLCSRKKPNCFAFFPHTMFPSGDLASSAKNVGCDISLNIGKFNNFVHIYLQILLKYTLL